MSSVQAHGPELDAGEAVLAALAPAPARRHIRGRRHLWIVQRLAVALATLFAISILVFAATQALPGDPARVILGHDATRAQLADLRAQYGFDKPLLTQYADWLKGAVTGDFGQSISAHQAVTTVLGDRLTNSAILVLLTMLAIVPLALVVGTVVAVRADRAMDHAVTVVALVLNALPEFVIGLGLVMLFATNVLKVLPAVALIPPGASPLAHPSNLVLPVATLALATAPYLIRLVRASVMEVLQAEYVRMAELKGLHRRTILIRHVLPNALIPFIQGAALTLAFLAGGVVIVEYLFAYPGIGGALTQAVTSRDVPVIQAVTLILACVYVGANLLADVLVVYATPKLRRG